MENPEIANMRAAQEYDTAETNIHQRVNSIHLLAEVFGCNTEDVEVMLSLLRVHDLYDMVEAAKDNAGGAPVEWSFATMVTAARTLTLKVLYGRIGNDLHDKLAQVTVSTQPSICGTAITDVAGLDEKTAIIFTDMIRYGVNLERMSALGKAYNKSLFPERKP